MKLSELKEQLKNVKTKTEKNIYIVTTNFYLDIDKQGNLVNYEDKPHVFEFIDISHAGFILIHPYAHGAYTDAFLNEIAKTEIQMLKLDFWGNPVWEFNPSSRMFANLNKLQIMLTTDQFYKERQQFIINLIKEKIKTESMTLSSEEIPKMKGIEKWIKDIMIVEGRYASEYWQEYQKEINYSFSRATEKQKSLTNKNATDYINVLLNLGYGILAHQITYALYAEGLNPTIGFYHTIQTKGQRYSLTWDLIEPYRTLIDNIVKEHIKDIDTQDFVWNYEDSVRYLMLSEDKNSSIKEFGKLKETSYKAWVKIFLTELKPYNYQYWIQQYKILLKQISEDIISGKDEANRATGYGNAKYIVDKFKGKKTKKPEIVEKIKGNMEEKPTEEMQEKDISLT